MIDKLRQNLDSIASELGREKFSLRPNIVSKRLDVSVRTVYRLVAQNELEAISFSPRSMRISENSVEDYLKRLNGTSLSDTSDDNS